MRFLQSSPCPWIVAVFVRCVLLDAAFGRGVTTVHEFVGFHPVIATELNGHVDNAADPLISVNLRMALVTPSDPKSAVPVLMMFSRSGFPAPESALHNGAHRLLRHQRGSWMATVVASPVWALLGAPGLSSDNLDYHMVAPMPPVNDGLLGGKLAWRQDGGGHTDAPNMKYFIHWANKFIGYTDQE